MFCLARKCTIFVTETCFHILSKNANLFLTLLYREEVTVQDQRPSKDIHELKAFFFRVSSPNGRPQSQAFLAETVETGDKNRDDFHCTQMSLVMSMGFIFGDD